MKTTGEVASECATRSLPREPDPLEVVEDLFLHWLALRRLGVMSWRQVFTKIRHELDELSLGQVESRL